MKRPTTFAEQFPDLAEDKPGTKERVIFILKNLLTLVENDHIRAEEIAGLTNAEILDLAEREAQKAADGAADLKKA
jgi:hypothetical protein